jgi:hypothetical protein
MYMTEHGMQDDSVRREHAQWEKAEAAEAAGRNKGKGMRRPNYMGMTDADFHRIYRKDFYADQERDDSIEGRMYWCIEHLHIHQDVYWSFRYPLRRMGAIDMHHLQRKPYFDDALHVIERMGLTQLLSL